MPTWGELLDTVSEATHNGQDMTPVNLIRTKLINDLAAYRDRNVICYYSGWLQRSNVAGVGIDDLDMNGFMNSVAGMDRSKGLDLILHTPGGMVSATESIIHYLRECFGNNVSAFVPQMAMSGGTMIACSCKEIYMGRQSSIGPTDPQFNGTPASGIVEEFENAMESVRNEPATIPLWAQIIGKYPPAYIGESRKALRVSKEILLESLKANMLSSTPNTAESVVEQLTSHADSGMHDRHFPASKAKEMGLNVIPLEHDNKLQDLVLSIHHIFMIIFQQTTAFKIVANNQGHDWILSGPNGS